VNRLADSTSPYLIQHAANPVDWYPWGPEALARAAMEDKPIFLSIGYASCHWCHVMEHNDFENQTIADALNRDFVSIKVDREERPDIDAQYMLAAQIMSGGGGWPLSAFLFPDLRPFFAMGRYFPPDDFLSLLQNIARIWKTERAGLEKDAAAIAERMRAYGQADTQGAPGTDLVQRAVAEMAKHYDPVRGGFNTAPKFPSVPGLWLLFDHGEEMLHFTLHNIARGGIHDHIGGGFFRYSVDEKWLVPHFEKMLYDQAQLAAVFSEAYTRRPDPDYRAAALGIRDYLAREMTSPEGAFYSSLDADSEGEEGKFYVFTEAEIREVLGQSADEFIKTYGVTPHGNFEGSNVFELVEGAVGALPEARAAILAARSKRVRPQTDDKVLCGWNGLMIGGLARMYQVFGDQQSLDMARRAADFILRDMRPSGVLQRSYRDGRFSGEAYLSDYAFLADGLLTLADATGEPEYRAEPERLVYQMAERLGDPENGGLFDYPDAEDQVVRLKNAEDNAEPSGNGMAARVFRRLGSEKADQIAYAFGELISRMPSGFPTLVLAASHREPIEFQYARGQVNLRLADGWYIDAGGLEIDGTAMNPEEQLRGEVAFPTPMPGELQVRYQLCNQSSCLMPVTIFLSENPN